MDASHILTAVFALLGSLAGAAGAAHFALKNFYQQKIWDMKAESYSVILECLYDMLFVLQRSTHPDTKISREEDEANYEKAHKALHTRLFRETWLFPDDVRNRLYELTTRFQSPISHDEAQALVFQTMSTLRDTARKDLKISTRRPSYYVFSKRRSAI